MDDERLLILRKKKLTAKTIVEQQRIELRLLTSSLSLNERLEEIYKRFDRSKSIDVRLLKKICQPSNLTTSNLTSHQSIRQTIDDLSNLLERIQQLLSMHVHFDFKHNDLHKIVNEQKQCLQSIRWKLADIYAHRVADEVSCTTS
jgi:isocitrate dehydrogenase kinase/phosphatase